MAIATLAFAVNYYFFGFDTGGIPRGYFLDIFGVYAAIFSPVLFLYFIYTLYLHLVKFQRRLDMLWFIAFTAFILSIILSLRQFVRLEDFAPFTVIAVPMMVRAFLNSYRVRLPRFRMFQNVLLGFIALFLIGHSLITFFNKPLYLLTEHPKNHFSFEYHFASELAGRLKAQGIDAVRADHYSMQLRLRFYGISQGGPWRLLSKEVQGAKPVTFTLMGRPIYRVYLLKDEVDKKRLIRPGEAAL